MQPRPSWFVYLIECRDGSLYTGITVDVARRYAQHAAGTGARYTRSHPPLRLVGQCACVDRSEASRMEYRIKRLTAPQKRALCGAWSSAAAQAHSSAHSSCSTPHSETPQTSVRR